MNWRDTPIYDAGLGDFTRIAWTTAEAQSEWEPRIARVSAMLQEVERQSVAEGQRACALLSVDPAQLVEIGAWAAERELCLLPLSRQAASPYSYSAVGRPAEAGEPFTYRAVLGTPAAVKAMRRAWEASDNRAMGELLGYPACCRDFFEDVWVKAGWIDTTWPMACGSVADGAPDGASIEVSGPAAANILLRWLGVRAVPHLPCSFGCAASAAMGEAWLGLGRAHGHAEAAADLLEMLDWPMEWSALHGLAEIKTPVNKVSTRTVATPHKLVVRRRGVRPPSTRPSGLRFPFQLSHRARARLKPPPGVAPDGPALLGEDFHRDNGFASLPAMRQAHRQVLTVATDALAGAAECRVLDLGCGNGALLAEIVRAAPGCVPMGVEADLERALHARALLPRFHDRFLHGDLHELEAPWREPAFDLVLLMPGRLLEANEDRAARLRNRLAKGARKLLVYAYADTAAAHGGLEGLCARAGLTLLAMGEHAPPCAALAAVPALAAA